MLSTFDIRPVMYKDLHRHEEPVLYLVAPYEELIKEIPEDVSDYGKEKLLFCLPLF